VEPITREYGRFLPGRDLKLAAKIHYTEDALAQQTTADYMGQQLHWRWILAWNNKEFSSLVPRGLEIGGYVLFPKMVNGVMAV